MPNALPIVDHRSQLQRLAAIAAVAIGIVLASFAHHSPAAGAYDTWQNDNFSGAAVMPGNAGSLHEFTGGATREAGEPAATGNNTVWFKWTPSYSGAAKLTFRGSQCYYNNGTGS